ncbi:uncharacterized protein LOC127703079 isoform X7 [Mytilus californianus]|uniref:uncharacterized protein LOC127703079 isoform X7 n=1 Tax=Mytilus californianus TaxID=6549 RepID=UPI0022483D1F|nr:uncharacterized protein LOC127703079 isoform X7 [Mytilus californianus]
MSTSLNNPGIAPLMIQETTNQPPLTENRNQHVFPVRTFKVLGGIQIGLGVLIGILSLIGVVMDTIGMHKLDDCKYQQYQHSYDYDPSYFNRCYSYRNSNLLFSFDLSCLICSGWFVLTGFLPMCMSKKRESSWLCLKVGFMVCSIIGASIFFLTVFTLGVIGAIVRSIIDGSKGLGMLSIFITLLSFAESVLAIISASYCCQCCTTWRIPNQTQRVLFVNSSQSGPILTVPQTNVLMGNTMVIRTEHTDNPVVQYPTAQQYQIINTNEPIIQQIQSGVSTQSSIMNIQQPQVFNTSPPPYKE